MPELLRARRASRLQLIDWCCLTRALERTLLIDSCCLPKALERTQGQGKNSAGEEGSN